MPSPSRPDSRDECPLRRAQQCKVGLRLVGRVAMLEQRDLRDHAAGRIDLGAIEVRRDRDRSRPWARARPRAGAGVAAGASRWRGWRGDVGRRAAGFPAARCAAIGGAGGRCSFCHASHRKSADIENTMNRIRRCVSMETQRTALSRRGGMCGSGPRSVRHGVVAPGMIRVTARDAFYREPGAAERAVRRDRFVRVIGAGRRESAVAPSSGRSRYW